MTRVRVPMASVRAEPLLSSMQETQALHGEQVDVMGGDDAWRRVRLARDGYEGFIDAAELMEEGAPPTHRVSVPLTLSFPAADIKSTPIVHLPLNAELAVAEERGRFLRLADRRYVMAAHASVLDSFADDFVAVAEQFLGVPYLWGGKSFMGLDCSGLVQTALHAAGRNSPRDSDEQEQMLGQAADGFKRGDLVFWKGHVGIMTDGKMLLHANGHHMMVVKEPLAEAISRIKGQGSEITAVKRLATRN
jgi:cell wall-associated NlpC family hydrolase